MSGVEVATSAISPATNERLRSRIHEDASAPSHSLAALPEVAPACVIRRMDVKHGYRAGAVTACAGAVRRCLQHRDRAETGQALTGESVGHPPTGVLTDDREPVDVNVLASLVNELSVERDRVPPVRLTPRSNRLRRSNDRVCRMSRASAWQRRSQRLSAPRQKCGRSAANRRATSDPAGRAPGGEASRESWFGGVISS